ncbi:hypothetical protein NKJ46_07715 [Mesorhizobium sp. M0166]|uniref:hypothetical protein n=1 Tax=unclassified Mesorhizobium TaxID=325217 RepID=UPI00333947F4
MSSVACSTPVSPAWLNTMLSGSTANLGRRHITEIDLTAMPRIEPDAAAPAYPSRP